MVLWKPAGDNDKPARCEDCPLREDNRAWAQGMVLGVGKGGGCTFCITVNWKGRGHTI